MNRRLKTNFTWKVGLLIVLLLCILYLLFRTYYNVDMNSTIPILMVVTEWSPHREKLFTRCLKSLTLNTRNHISLHLIVDHKSTQAASQTVKDITGWQRVDFTTYSIESIIKKYSHTIKSLQKSFSISSKPYYHKGVFYLIPFIHKIIREEKVIVLDTDIVVLADIKELYDEFDSFHSSQFWGVTYEQSPYYARALSTFRRDNKNTVFGGYTKNGGVPGINAGVLLVNIRKLIDDSYVQDNYLTEAYYTYLVNRFKVQGELVLGDQDFLSLLYFEHPELFYVIGCGWNRQLCMYFQNDPDFGVVFDLYYECNESVSIFHGNCNSTIPNLGN